MIEGWIRAWKRDSDVYFTIKDSDGWSAAIEAQAEFRKNFRTPLRAEADETSSALAELDWDSRITLPHGISDEEWTEVHFSSDGSDLSGFIKTAHLVEIRYVDYERSSSGKLEAKHFKATLTRSRDRTSDLLWGDLVQVISRENGTVKVRARGLFGTMADDRLSQSALLESYFIDVGQGDGVLVRFPDGKHMMIDGGLSRNLQMTGKNAADFVDWKFFSDYGGWRIDLDWMIASHSDADHYGGLADLIAKDQAALDELDCLEIGVTEFGHPGLSRFPAKIHSDKFGPRDPVDGRQPGVFTRLMGDRADAQALVDGSGADGLKISGWWKAFISDVLKNSADTGFTRLSLSQNEAQTANLPEMMTGDGYSVKILGPVTLDHGGSPAIKDLGSTGINSNGHSVCLRLDYGDARILMTGDLNSASMYWLTEAFDDKIDEWKCDVAKACHHGSDDVSYKFLQAINAAATVISSGDNEGHAHPRPEIVAASALSGHVELSDDEDRVITPLIYMTEIERSVLLGEINRIEIKNSGEAGHNHTVLGKPVTEFSGKEYLSVQDWQQLDDLDRSELGADEIKDQKKALEKAIINRESDRLTSLEGDEVTAGTEAVLYARRPTGVVGTAYPRKELKRAHVMEKNIYGLVNVRTDGKLIMCASKRDNGENWTIHHFNARFG